MRVTRIEIFGFKSFVERFVLNFDQKLIGIIGPNGCGKSNIVDSLRWVLGETYAKQLRGTLLEDLIFSGSDSRRPLGMAEVSITIRPSEGWSDTASQPLEQANSDLDIEIDPNFEISAAQNEEEKIQNEIDKEIAQSHKNVLNEIPGLLNASEIQFTRRLYRSGESEYFINKIPCRLRDMTEVYRLIGLGARGLSIVQQGEIGQLISKKPTERRELLEEAAGISGFRTRMEAAQRKLEKTSENMARLRDIIIEIEKQVKVLSRQAKRARERNEIKTELKEYELDLFTARSAQIILLKKDNEKNSQALKEDLDGVSFELNLSESKQLELRAELENFDLEILELRKKRDNFQSIINAEQGRTNDLKLKLALNDGKIEELAKNVSGLEQRKRDLQAEAEDRELNLVNLEQELHVAIQKKELAEEELKNLQQHEEERKNTIQLELPNILNSADFVAKNDEIEQLLRELEQMPGLEQRIKTLQNQIQEQTQKIREQLGRVSSSKIKIASVESEISTLEKQLDTLAENVVKTVSSTEQEVFSEKVSGLNKVLLAGIKVPEKLQRAVAAILGEKAQYLVTSEASILGQSFSQKNKSGSEQQIKIGVIDQSYKIKSSNQENITEAEKEICPNIVSLVSSLSFDSELETIAQSFLGEYFLVDTLEQALKINDHCRENSETLRFLVTLAGEVVTPWGWYTTEGKAKVFSFTRRISELKEQLAVLSEQLKSEETTSHDWESLLTEQKQDLVNEQTKREHYFGVQRRVLRLKQELQDSQKQAQDSLIIQERKNQEAYLQQDRKMQENLRSVISEQSRLFSQLNYEQQKIKDLLKEIERLEDSKQNLISEQESLKQEKLNLQNELNQGAVERGINLEQIQSECKEIDTELFTLNDRREPIRLLIAEESESIVQLRRSQSQKQELLNKLLLQIEKADLELTMLGEDVCKNYPETPVISDEQIENILQKAQGELSDLIGQLQENAGKLRRRIEREGEVDPQSIELYEQESSRLESLQTQYNDLEYASNILERTIARLKHVSKERFLETFTFVSKKFEELLPRLFGGGSGHLELINSEDPLSSGVEIFIRPPGKKVSNMELLSGGEKALVAVAVIISMFLHRPSPICVLDEVDAPLDDANLERYLNMIREISASTQFLVITHNKRTMSMMQRLVGITMQEKGVSTALSVTLEESESEIDRWVANA